MGAEGYLEVRQLLQGPADPSVPIFIVMEPVKVFWLTKVALRDGGGVKYYNLDSNFEDLNSRLIYHHTQGTQLVVLENKEELVGGLFITPQTQPWDQWDPSEVSGDPKEAREAWGKLCVGVWGVTHYYEHGTDDESSFVTAYTRPDGGKWGDPVRWMIWT